MTDYQQESGFVEAEDCKEYNALARGEDGVGTEQDLEKKITKIKKYKK